MKITKVNKSWVSIVEDVDCGNLSFVDTKVIYNLFKDRKILIFKDQHLDDDQLKSFAEIFGSVWDRDSEIKFSGLDQTAENNPTGHVELVSESGILGNKHVPWHIDLTHFPSQILPNRLLYAVELEGESAPTEFVYTLDCEKQLPKDIFEFLRSTNILCKAPYPTPWKDYVRRPALNYHPVDNKYALMIDPCFTQWIDRLDADIIPFFKELMTYINTNETNYKHTWEMHDLVVYDNWSTIHQRKEFNGSRKLKRVTWDQDWFRK